MSRSFYSILLFLFLSHVSWGQFNIISDTIFGTNKDEHIYAIKQTLDSCYIGVGYTNTEVENGDILITTDPDGSGPHGGEDIWVVKWDKDGDIVWQNCIGTSSSERGYDIVVTDQNEYVLVGYTYSDSLEGDLDLATASDSTGPFPRKDLWVVKLNTAGNIVWQNVIGGSGDDRGLFVLQTKDKGLFISAHRSHSQPYPAHDGDFIAFADADGSIPIDTVNAFANAFYIKLDSNGRVEWLNTLVPTNYSLNYPISSVELESGNFIVGVNDLWFPTKSYQYDVDSVNDLDGVKPWSDTDLWLVKLDKNGQIVWQNTYGEDALFSGCCREERGGMIIGNDGNIVIAVTITATGNDFFEPSLQVDQVGMKGNDDIWICKIDTNANILWSNIIGGDAQDNFWQIVKDQSCDSGYVLSINSSSGISGDKSIVNHYPSGLPVSNWLVTISEDGWVVDDDIISQGSLLSLVPAFEEDKYVAVARVDSLTHDGSLQLKGSADVNFMFLDRDFEETTDFIFDTTKVCAGDSVNFFHTPFRYNGNYLWELKNDNFVTLNTSQGLAPSFYMADSGTYHVKLKSYKLCEWDSVEKTILIDKQPDIQVLGDDGICRGDSTQLILKGAWNYSWEPELYISCDTCDTIEIFPLNSMVYEVIGFSENNNCPDTNSFIFEVLDKPYSVLADDTAMCKNSEITLNAENLGQHYLWSSGETAQEITIEDTGYYYVRIYNEYCFKFDTIIVSILEVIPEFSIIADSTVCEGDSLQVQTVGTQTHLWSPNESFFCDTCDITNVFLDASDYIYITAFSETKKCSESDSLFIEVSPPIELSLSLDTVICELEAYSIVLPPKYNYTWFDSTTGNIYNVAQEGIYKVEISDGTCTKVDSILIENQSYPDIEDMLDTTICIDEAIVIGHKNTNPLYDYIWNNDFIGSLLEVFNPGKYILAVKNESCISRDTVIVELSCLSDIFVPNVFTPDGNGDNDDFKATYKGITSLTLRVYNRLGTLLFIGNKGDTWDGKYKGKRQQSGVYTYSLYAEGVDGKAYEKTGVFNLKR